jgi:hypothetical protein
MEKEDHYSYAWRDIVDDTVHEEDFQDVNDDNERYPQYSPFHVNAYNQVERYLEPPPFCKWRVRGGIVPGMFMMRWIWYGGVATMQIGTTKTPMISIAGRGAHLQRVLRMHGVHGHITTICRLC